MNKKKIKFPVLTLTGEGDTRLKYRSALSRFLGFELQVGEHAINEEEHIFVGGRSFYHNNDGIEFYYLKGTLRHSICVVEWQRNGGYKLVVHTVNMVVTGKGLVACYPGLLNNMLLKPLFPNWEVYYQAGYLCAKTPTCWIPMRIDALNNPKHFAFIHSLDLVDNPDISPLTGARMNDRWNSNFIATEPMADPLTLHLSPLAQRAVPNNVRSVETRFNPDTEVEDIPGDQL